MRVAAGFGMRTRLEVGLLLLLLLGVMAFVACTAAAAEGEAENTDKAGDGGPGSFGDGGSTEQDQQDRDPADCTEAANTKSYVGCDYWPTITPNVVDPIFDFVVVVANVGVQAATVTVSGPNNVGQEAVVPSGGLKKIFLPWVADLKGTGNQAATTLVQNGAYHLVSTNPVVVYQFNPLQYRGAGEGPNGAPKDWSSCKRADGGANDCLSFTNDASLLLPSSALTGNYRVTAMGLAPIKNVLLAPSVLTITATEPGTTVNVDLSSTADIRAGIAGTGIAEGGRSTGSSATFVLANRGDVAQLATNSKQGAGIDFSGTAIRADKPVQVISSVPCTTLPAGVFSCDHIEEAVMPAETLGKHYVIATPTGATGTAAKQIVRLYGNRNGTKLTYLPSRPAACPETLAAGQLGDCGVVDQSFEVTGDNEFGVATFLLGTKYYSDANGLGDPSMTTHPSVEQYRKKYIFLAPNDYPVQWADVTGPEDAQIELDGQAAQAPWTSIGAGTDGVRRLDLTKSGHDGAHMLTSSKRVGLQVIGYGRATSFQYPGGLNLKLIAPPPPPR